MALKIYYALQELPHDPFIAFAADYKQLQPVNSSGVMAKICGKQTTITLTTIHRTDDEELLGFLGDDDEIIVADAPHVVAMHPGYVGPGLLDRPCTMAPDGLCLYHCLVAAIDYADYMGLTQSEREARAEGLRCATIVYSEITAYPSGQIV